MKSDISTDCSLDEHAEVIWGALGVGVFAFWSRNLKGLCKRAEIDVDAKIAKRY